VEKKIIGKVAATEKNPTTIDVFSFWSSKDLILNPFDIIRVDHINDSVTFGMVEEISHITDSTSYLTSFISNDFGDVNAQSYTERIAMNYITAKVVGNTKGIYIPVTNGAAVRLANEDEIEEALGLKDVQHPLVCGYLEMYESVDDADKVVLPVKLNSKFLIGPEGAHLNISGISGLAAKTSYAMFLMKAMQEASETEQDMHDTAFVFLNVKGMDLLALDELAHFESDEERRNTFEAYRGMGLSPKPMTNVKYFYPFSGMHANRNTYATKERIEEQFNRSAAKFFKYEYESDKRNLDLMFSNIDDPTETMESVLDFIINEQGNFGNLKSWNDFLKEIDEYCKPGNEKRDKEIRVQSWNKFKRIIKKSIYNNPLFGSRVEDDSTETRLEDALKRIQKNDVFVIDIAKLDEGMQSFVFGDVIRAVYNLKLGEYIDDGVDEEKVPGRIIIFIDELNKYASSDVPKNSPILRQIIDIAERGRSLGIILFSAEQFRSAIHDRVKGNCSTHAYGRTNAIEVSKKDYSFIPPVYKNMMTRLKQGEYIIQNPIFRSLINIKFPKPIYRQFK